MSEHKRCALSSNYGRNSTRFYNAIRKYGWETFKYSRLLECIDYSLEVVNEILNNEEINYISLYKEKGVFLYNMTSGGGEGVVGYIYTEEHKQKIGDSVRGEKNYWYGKKGTESPFYGKEFTEEHKKKIGDAQRGNKNHMFGKNRRKASFFW